RRFGFASDVLTEMLDVAAPDGELGALRTRAARAKLRCQAVNDHFGDAPRGRVLNPRYGDHSLEPLAGMIADLVARRQLDVVGRVAAAGHGHEPAVDESDVCARKGCRRIRRVDLI